MATDETQVMEQELSPAAAELVEKAASKQAKATVTLEQLLAQYTEYRANKSKMSPEEFDTMGRTLRRKIRAAGGTVNSLKPDAPASVAGEPKPAKEKKAKKSRQARVEAGLDGDPRAQPAGLAHVNWLERIFSGEEKLPEDPQITPMEVRSFQSLEQSGEYGYGIDVLSDVLPRQTIAKFVSRFGYEPTWFAINRPESYEIPTALTLLVLGPATAADELPAATEAQADPETIQANAAQAEESGSDEEDESWGDDDEEDEEG